MGAGEKPALKFFCKEGGEVGPTPNMGRPWRGQNDKTLGRSHLRRRGIGPAHLVGPATYPFGPVQNSFDRVAGLTGLWEGAHPLPSTSVSLLPAIGGSLCRLEPKDAHV